MSPPNHSTLKKKDSLHPDLATSALVLATAPVVVEIIVPLRQLVAHQRLEVEEAGIGERVLGVPPGVHDSTRRRARAEPPPVACRIRPSMALEKERGVGGRNPSESRGEAREGRERGEAERGEP